jgi:hypothetical protein
MPPLHPQTPPQTPHEPHVHPTQIRWIQAQEPKPDLLQLARSAMPPSMSSSLVHTSVVQQRWRRRHTDLLISFVGTSIL